MWNATFESKAESNQSRIFDCISRRNGESRRWNLNWFKRRINTSGGLSGSKFSFPVLLCCCAILLFCYDVSSFCYNILSFCCSGLMCSYQVMRFCCAIVLFCCFVMLFCLSFCYESAWIKFRRSVILAIRRGTQREYSSKPLKHSTVSVDIGTFLSPKNFSSVRIS